MTVISIYTKAGTKFEIGALRLGGKNLNTYEFYVCYKNYSSLKRIQ